MPFDKFKIWKFNKDRLEAFSDGVFAIVITLLVLELKVPHLKDVSDAHELKEKLMELFPVFLSWVISFLVVGALWLQHHNILRMAKKADYGLVWNNHLFLLFTTLIPFPTALMGEYPGIPLAVASFGIVMFFATGMLGLIYYYVVKNYLREEYHKPVVMKNVRFALIAGPVFYIVAIASAWFSSYITFAIYCIIPLLFLTPLDKPHKETEDQ
jgi:uncharacterized membrane protein